LIAQAEYTPKVFAEQRFSHPPAVHAALAIVSPERPTYIVSPERLAYIRRVPASSTKFEPARKFSERPPS
jgi:hypothetical protein